MSFSFKHCRFVRIFCGLALTMISGCKKDQSFSISDASNFDAVFEQFYKKMNANYCYWDIDKTNFDSLYAVYKPRFHKLDINNEDDRKKSVGYFRSMASTLIDNHFQIGFIDNSLRDSVIYPALDRKKHLANFHNKYDFSDVAKKYLDSDYVTSSYFYQEGNKSELLYSITGTIDQQIVYFSCNQFAFNLAIKNKDSGTIKVLQKLDELIGDSSGKLQSVIIDLRGNGGGDVADLNLILGRFIDQPLIIGYLKYKDGDGKFDYTIPVNSTILPNSGNHSRHFKKFVLLADNYSASLSEAFAATTRVLPGAKLIGETTWGANGPIADQAVFGYGGFRIGNFLQVTTAAGQFRVADGESHENIGFIPDLEARFDIQSYNAHIDAQLLICINDIINNI